MVIVSNRGPVSFTRSDDGDLVAKRGGGGLVASLAPAAIENHALWISAAMTDDDRVAAAQGVVEAEGMSLKTLDIDPVVYRQFYDVAFNQNLWFMHHHLWDLVHRPRFDHRFREAWGAYRDVNELFAVAIAETAPDGADVLVQDHHLALVGASLSAKRPDLRAINFCHTPFAAPDIFRVLPADVAAEFLSGLAGYKACGFHTRRWAQAFEACCTQVLRSCPPVFVSPPAPDINDLRGVAASPECAREARELATLVGDRHLIVRVDRIELSKNISRGFHAYAHMLEEHPELHGEVTFAAMVYPSRQGLPEYRAYRQEVESLVQQINDRFGTSGWSPVLYDPGDSFPRSVAALKRYDTLVVNPIRDGLNLVAFEGPLLNERDGTLLLSREAGAWEYLGPHASAVNPYDIVETAARLYESVGVPKDFRATRAAKLRATARQRTTADWIAAQRQAAAGIVA